MNNVGWTVCTAFLIATWSGCAREACPQTEDGILLEGRWGSQSAEVVIFEDLTGVMNIDIGCTEQWQFVEPPIEFDPETGIAVETVSMTRWFSDFGETAWEQEVVLGIECATISISGDWLDGDEPVDVYLGEAGPSFWSYCVYPA